MTPAQTIHPVTLNYAFLVSFREWLATQNVTANTTRVYCSRVKQFLLFLEYSNLGDKPLTNLNCMTELTHLYLEFLRKGAAAAESINGNINALQKFSQFLGLKENTPLQREHNYRAGGKVLSHSKLAAYLHCLNKQTSARDKALCLTLLYTGIRLADCANLSIDDVALEAGGNDIDKRPGNDALTYYLPYAHVPCGTITVLRARGDFLVQLNAVTTAALSLWVQERNKISSSSISDTSGIGRQALWLNTHGEPLSIHGIAFIVRKTGWLSGLTLSPEMLRRTGLALATDQLNQTEFASAFGGTISQATLNRSGNKPGNRFGFNAGLPEKPRAA